MYIVIVTILAAVVGRCISTNGAEEKSASDQRGLAHVFSLGVSS